MMCCQFLTIGSSILFSWVFFSLEKSEPDNTYLVKIMDLIMDVIRTHNRYDVCDRALKNVSRNAPVTRWQHTTHTSPPKRVSPIHCTNSLVDGFVKRNGRVSVLFFSKQCQSKLRTKWNKNSENWLIYVVKSVGTSE